MGLRPRCLHLESKLENSLILIVEDEPKIAEILIAYLEREGFRTICAGDGETALQHHNSLSPDLVLLDARLPKLDGFTVLARLRQISNTPVIMLTALTEDLDRLSGLRLGADDYISKPFNPLEVVARVKAVLRRFKGSQTVEILRVGNVEIDFKAYSVFVHQDEQRVLLPLTLSEFRILAYMIRRPTHAYERSDILDACLPESDALYRTVDTHISNLRRKFEKQEQFGFFTAVRGIGYRFCDPK